MKQRTWKKRFWLLLILAAFALSACAANQGALPINSINALYAFDTSDPAAVVGDATYVFIGKVIGFLGTEFFDDALPYTKYHIEVLENIKGDLKLGEICALKKGGLSKTRSEIFTRGEDDFFPQPGEVCVFSAYGQRDGSLRFYGAFSNVRIPLDAADAADLLEAIQKTDVYKLYIEAFENQVVRPDKQAPSLCAFDLHYTGDAKAEIPAPQRDAKDLVKLLPSEPQEKKAEEKKPDADSQVPFENVIQA